MTASLDLLAWWWTVLARESLHAIVVFAVVVTATRLLCRRSPRLQVLLWCLGLLRPIIVLPRKLVARPGLAGLAVAHEMAHVGRGEGIGTVGSTGWSTGPHQRSVAYASQVFRQTS